MPGLTGVWVGQDKLAAIGVRISRWVTSHGFALNVSTDLAYFDLIRACGLRDRGVTSLDRLTTAPVRLPTVQDALAAEFGTVFGRQVHPGSVATYGAACSGQTQPREGARQDTG